MDTQERRGAGEKKCHLLEDGAVGKTAACNVFEAPVLEVVGMLTKLVRPGLVFKRFKEDKNIGRDNNDHQCQYSRGKKRRRQTLSCKELWLSLASHLNWES